MAKPHGSHLVDKDRAHRVVDVVGIGYYLVHASAWLLDATAIDYVYVGENVGIAHTFATYYQ